MAIKKVERQLNLVICLLETRQFVTSEYIWQNVVGYDPTATLESFKRMFERDKAELRALGMPVLTGPAARIHGPDVEGYRIDRKGYELPDIHLDRDEAAAVAMAAAMWDSPDVAQLTQSAIRKLKGAGIDVRSAADVDIAPARISSEPVVGPLVQATHERNAVTFVYRRSGSDEAIPRTVEPWSVRISHGRGYLIGLDRDRQAQRTFRLSRMSGVKSIGKPGAFEVPADVDFDALLDAAISMGRSPSTTSTRIWVARDKAAGLRRRASSAAPYVLSGEDGDLLIVDVDDESALIRAVLGAGPDAVVLEPESLRRSVIDHVDAVLEATR